MSDIYKLQYNGMTLAYPGWNGYVGYDHNNQIYNLTLENDGHGTIGASQTSGHPGDIVTLSNTANAGYIFSSYAITGAELTGSEFAFNASDVTAKANFYQLSAQLYNNNTAITGNYKTTGTKTINCVVTAWPYVVLKFNHQAKNRSVVQINPLNWYFMNDDTLNSKGVRCYNASFTKQARVNYVNNGSYKQVYYDKNIKPSTNATYKFVIDRANNIASAFISNNYEGYGSIRTTTAIESVKIYSGISNKYIDCSNFYVAGFKNLADAVIY